MRRLAAHEISCTYVLLSALSNVLSEVPPPHRSPFPPPLGTGTGTIPNILFLVKRWYLQQDEAIRRTQSKVFKGDGAGPWFLGDPNGFPLTASPDPNPYPSHQVTKVLIGAAGVLTNGSVYSRIGTPRSLHFLQTKLVWQKLSQSPFHAFFSCFLFPSFTWFPPLPGTALVCLMAFHAHKPVLCCCETYKFTDKAWFNSLTSNEEGAGPPPLQHRWSQTCRLKPALYYFSA